MQTSRYRRIGVLATEATVASGSYVRAIGALDGGAEVIQQACPGLAAFIQEGDVASHEIVAAVRASRRRSRSGAPTSSSWAARTTR